MGHLKSTKMIKSWKPKFKFLKYDINLLWSIPILFIGFLIISPSALVGAEVSSFIKKYEPVFYNSGNVLEDHRRFKRESSPRSKVTFPKIDDEEDFKVNFFSRGRDFNLRLKVDNEVFHPGVIFENSEGPISYDTTRTFRGHLDGEPGSSVEGVLTSDGTFDASISTGKGQQYYIEPAKRLYDKAPIEAQGIIYSANDVRWPPPNGDSTCASHQLHLLRKEENHFGWRNDSRDGPETKRRKRYVIDHAKKTCMLYLQADHLFYKYFGSEEATIDIMTRHIQRLNEIYRATDFDMDGRPDDINFMIKRIKVHNINSTKEKSYKFKGDFPVIKYLEVFSEGDYDTFCLAYMFTFRDFEGGTLGLAWTGDLKNAGGVCERKGHFRGGIKSLNTGIITLLNYGKVVPLAVSHVTLAHEIGHNFGSPHDPEGDRQCTPGGEGGNFIMFARATAGDKKNNNKFSPCSIKSILPVLNNKAKDIHGCFTVPQGAICGNGVVEDGEECDCGWEEDCKEPCCFPMAVRPSKFEPPCRLRPQKLCSPSQGPCCTDDCHLKYDDKCRDDNGCRDAAYCNGAFPGCPKSRSKANKTVCNKDSVCFMGECTGSICLAYGLESCQCNDGYKLCELCCKLPGENQPCRSSYEWNEAPFDIPDMYSKPGSPCKNYTGYCDNYHTCREVDPSGPLATLRKLLLADEGLATIFEWIDNHWYAIISVAVLIVLLMVLTAKMCGKRAKESLRKLTVMHSNVDAIQIQRDYIDENGVHVVHPTAVRKKIPIHKKVRERRSKSRKRREQRKAENVNSSPTNPGPSAPLPGPSSGAPKPSSKVLGSGKGTLWRKRREKERARLKKANKNGRIEETEMTPPVVPPLALKPRNQNSTQNGNSKALGSPNLIGFEPLAQNMNNLNKPSTSGASKSPTNPGGNSIVTHEAKTVVVPHAKDQNRNVKRQHRSKTTSKSKPPQSPPKSKNSSRPKATGEVKAKKSRDSSGHQEASTAKPAKKNIQVIFSPPFSVKVNMVPSSSSGSPNKSHDPQKNPHPSSSHVKHSSSSPNAKATKSSSGLKAAGSSLLGAHSNLRKGNMAKRKKNPELRVLIPPNHEDEEINSPITPYS